MLATFPDFTPISLDDRDEIEEILRRFEPYSDFNFVSLFCWNTDGINAVSKLNDGIVIRLSDYLADGQSYSYLSDGKDTKEALEKILEITDRLEYVPEQSVRTLGTSHDFEILEDPDNHDYVYDVTTLSTLNGGMHKKKRNKVNNFEKEMADLISIKHKTAIGKTEKRELIELFERWCLENGISRETQEDEYIALQRVAKHFNDLNLVLTEVRLKGELRAFSINQIFDNGYSVCHFEKTLNIHRNLSPYLVREVAKMLCDKGCKYVNWEQDLGLEGLKQAKKSYRHDHFLKKYKVRRLNKVDKDGNI